MPKFHRAKRTDVGARRSGRQFHGGDPVNDRSKPHYRPARGLVVFCGCGNGVRWKFFEEDEL